MSVFHEEARRLEPSHLVSLFQLDTTRIGGPVYHFTTETRAGSQIAFGGVEYTAVPVRISGLSISGTGPIQTPTLAISNADGMIQEILNSFGNLEGCQLSRMRVFARHIDDGEEPNSSAFFGPDIYVIDRKSTDTPEMVEWELTASIDQRGVYVGRTMVRDTCLWRYREFNATLGTFDYSKAICPYAGNSYFDENNEPVASPSEDKPSRNIGCCRARFGTEAPLPFGGFPGMIRGVV